MGIGNALSNVYRTVFDLTEYFEAAMKSTIGVTGTERSGIPNTRKLEQRLQNEVAACEMFERCYGKEAFQAVKLFLQLDTLDQGRIIGSMETLLEDEKYSIQKESLNGKAI